MRRVVVLAAWIAVIAWLARDARWQELLPPQLAARSAPYDRYVGLLRRTGLADAPPGQSWMRASAAAITAPTRISLPFDRTLPPAAQSPDAHGLRVTLNRGQRVEVTAETIGSIPAAVFVDIFQADDDDPAHEVGAIRAVQHEAAEDGEVIVRVQPELLGRGPLKVTVRAAPALRFPVANARPRDLHSVFGDPRDAGRRQHEGVDIFAQRGTAVLSATDGIVTRVGEGGIGGRVVWVWDPSRGLRLYYAHLHEQLVSSGDRVSAGDVIGTVGNTGNARTTPPHLHFGIYERGSGAIDPYWFIAPQS